MIPQKSVFWKIGVYFYIQKSVERGRFVFWRTIIRPPFTFEWRDRVSTTDLSLYTNHNWVLTPFVVLNTSSEPVSACATSPSYQHKADRCIVIILSWLIVNRLDTRGYYSRTIFFRRESRSTEWVAVSVTEMEASDMLRDWSLITGRVGGVTKQEGRGS